jgi:hypothetical protein
MKVHLMSGWIGMIGCKDVNGVMMIQQKRIGTENSCLENVMEYWRDVDQVRKID